MSAQVKIKYSITLKLVTIVAVLLLVSLGTMTALVSVLVSKDVQLTAEVNNFSINRRISESAENELKNIRHAAASFLNDTAIIETTKPGAAGERSAFFFASQPSISGIILCSSASVESDTPVESDTSVESDAERRVIMPASSPLLKETMEEWLLNQKSDIERALAGETLIRNASPFFEVKQLVMLLPISIIINDTAHEYAAAVFFSQDNFIKILGNGANVSFLLNDAGTMLAHPEPEIVEGAVNLSNIPFVANALESADRGTQTIYTDEDGVEHFGVYQRLGVANSLIITIIKRADVFSGIIATTRRNIFISLGVLAFSILMIIIFAGSMSRQLRALTNAALKIEEGDYALDLKPKTSDEIGTLTKSFIGMGLGIENFEKFTNKAIVRLARKGKLSRGGQNKNITVAFILIRDFSELSKDMSAEQIVSFVNEYLEMMVPCITETGGIVDKFLTQGGVIIMAVWGLAGAASAPDKIALRCVCSLLMIRATLVDYNQELMRRFWGYAPRIKIGCGINSGDVVAGQMGSERRMEYTVIGDTVNLAARLEGANDVFDTDILISENTWNLIRKRIIVQEMPSIAVKGKEKPLRVFSVINLRTLEAASRLFLEMARMRGETSQKQAVNYWTRSMEEVRLLWDGHIPERE